MDYITIEFIAFTINIIMLSIASYFDIKERLVSDLLWIVMLVPGIFLLAIRFLEYNNDLISDIIISIIFSIIIAILFSISGLWGGADGLAIFMLILINPFSFNDNVVHHDKILTLFQIIPFSLNIIINAYIIALLFPLALLLYNFIQYKRYSYLYLEPIHIPKWQKIIVSFIGYPISIEKLEKKDYWHYELLEKKNKKSIYLQQRIPLLLNLRKNNNVLSQKFTLTRFLGLKNSVNYKLNSIMTIEDETVAIFKRMRFLQEAKENERNSVWIQYSLPFIFLILLGYIFTVFYGNIVLIFVDLIN